MSDKSADGVILAFMRPRMSRLRILLADDDPADRATCRDVLVVHEIIEAQSITEAREAYANTPVDVVIAEWNLIDGCGGSFLAELHSAGDLSHRIIHTGTMADQIEQLVASGIAHRSFWKPSWRELALYLSQLHWHRRTLEGRRRSLDRCDSRKAPRKVLRLIAFVRSSDWKSPRRLFTEDVCCGGLSLSTSEPLPLDTILRIVVTASNGERFWVKGAVRHATPVAEVDRSVAWRIGVSLEDSSEHSRFSRVFELWPAIAKLREGTSR